VTTTRIVSTLLCAALLTAFAPAGVTAQTHATPKAAAGEARSLTAPRAAEKPTLKAMFSESAFKTRTGALSEADFKRFEASRWQNDPQQQPAGKGWSTRKKVIVIVVAAVVVGLAAWAAANSDGEVPPAVSCSENPFEPNCI